MHQPPLPSLIFVHIPKAAGTTLETVVRRPYQTNETYPVRGDVRETLARFQSMEMVARARVRCLYGHIPFGRHSMVGPVVYMTMLRDPIERLISHYYYARSEPAMYLHDVAMRSDLLGYASSGASELDNGQTRLISGVAEVDTVHGHGRLTGVVLEEARRNLANTIVGLTEAFDESLLHFRQAFGWGNICYLSQNVTPGRPPSEGVPADIRALLGHSQQLDRELYDCVVVQFRRQRETFGIRASEVRRFRALNAVYRSFRHLRRRSVAILLDKVFENLQRCLLGTIGVRSG